MECDRLINLIKEWYICVKQETMAHVRMMQFIDKHIKECETCRNELGLQEEIEKIREYILPESLLTKSEPGTDEDLTPEISPDENENAEGEYVDGSEDDADYDIDEEL